MYKYGKNENKKTKQGIRRMLLFIIELFANVTHFGFYMKPSSGYYVHFRANTLGKGMNPFILPAMG